MAPIVVVDVRKVVTKLPAAVASTASTSTPADALDAREIVSKIRSIRENVTGNKGVIREALDLVDELKALGNLLPKPPARGGAPAGGAGEAVTDEWGSFVEGATGGGPGPAASSGGSPAPPPRASSAAAAAAPPDSEKVLALRADVVALSQRLPKSLIIEVVLGKGTLLLEAKKLRKTSDLVTAHLDAFVALFEKFSEQELRDVVAEILSRRAPGDLAMTKEMLLKALQEVEKDDSSTSPPAPAAPSSPPPPPAAAPATTSSTATPAAAAADVSATTTSTAVLPPDTDGGA